MVTLFDRDCDGGLSAVTGCDRVWQSVTEFCRVLQSKTE